MDDTEGGVFTLEGVQREAEALLDGIMNLRRNSTDVRETKSKYGTFSI